MQLSHRKMECAQLIILLYYWQNQNQEAYVSQINLGELVKNQKNWDTILLSSFHPTVFMTLVKIRNTRISSLYLA